MPTLNETAEVLRLRAALEVMQAYLTGPVEFETRAPELYALWLNEQEGLNPGGYLRLYVEIALAAEPAPLVAAVEGVVRALVALRNEVSGTIFSDSAAILNLREAAGNTNVHVLETRLGEADSAIAAYHAALGQGVQG